MGHAPSVAPQPLPPAPTTDAAENLARVQGEKEKAIRAQGLGATILTGGLGASDYGTAGQRTTGATTLGSTG